jgi:hypothetical protein
MHNPGYDELFFASHYIRGLKDELRAPVYSQAPDTIDRASFFWQRFNNKCLIRRSHDL